MGISREEYLRRFKRVNLLDSYPGSAGKGDRFDFHRGRQRAEDLLDEWADCDYHTIVLLGWNVHACFAKYCFHIQSYFECDYFGNLTFYVHPHPSGLNRWWNDSNNVEAARRFWSKLL
jgi:hypothetical protein